MSSTEIVAIVDPETQLSLPAVKKWVAAVQAQLKQFCLAWGLTSVKLRLAKPGEKVATSSRRIVFLNDADSPGALGYHSDDDGTAPIGKVFVRTILENNESISVTFSHEVLEMVADPFANWWAQYGDSLYALEVCDPVEGDLYLINGVQVSNFVLPAYFDATPESGVYQPYDWCNRLKAPFTMTAGGYLIKMKAGKVTSVFAKGYPAWKKKMKKAGKSRSAKRGAFKS
jgi:hypothetical protein